VILGEIGVDVSRFTTEKHFASWLGVCPRQYESNHTKKKRSPRRGKNRPARLRRLRQEVEAEGLTLLAARLMPADFAKKDNGLHRCHIRVFHGFIFINLSDEAPPDFDAAFADLDPYLDFHGFADAKIAHAASYPTTANWKLIVENFVECYHCAPAHPEFCSMHPPEALIAFGAGPSSGPADAVEKYLPVVKAWEATAAAGRWRSSSPRPPIAFGQFSPSARRTIFTNMAWNTIPSTRPMPGNSSCGRRPAGYTQ
jgi:hypothetical protein